MYVTGRIEKTNVTPSLALQGELSFDPTNRYLTFLFLECVTKSKRTIEEQKEKYVKYQNYSIKELIFQYLLKGVKSLLKEWKSTPEHKLCRLHFVAVGHLLDFDFELLGNEIQKIWGLDSKEGKKDPKIQEDLIKKADKIVGWLDDEESFELEDSLMQFNRFDEACKFYRKCGLAYVKLLGCVAAQANEAAKHLRESALPLNTGPKRKKKRKCFYPKELYGPDLPALAYLLDKISSIASTYVRLIKPDLQALALPPSSWKEREALIKGMATHISKSCSVLNSSFPLLAKNNIYLFFEVKMGSISYDEAAEAEMERARQNYQFFLEESQQGKESVSPEHLKKIKEAYKNAVRKYNDSQISQRKMTEFDQLAFGIRGQPEQSQYGALMGNFTTHMTNIKEMKETWNDLAFFSGNFQKHLFDRLEEMPEDEHRDEYDLMALIDELDFKRKRRKRKKRRSPSLLKKPFSSSSSGCFSASLPSKTKNQEKKKIKETERPQEVLKGNIQIKSPIQQLLSDLKMYSPTKYYHEQKHIISRSGTLLGAKLRQNFHGQNFDDLSEAALEDTCSHLFFSACGLEMLYLALEHRDWQAFQSIVTQLILDWHGMAEQSRNLIHLSLYGKKSPTHHLVALSKRIKEFLDWNEEELCEIQHHLEELDNGLMWARFPKSQNHTSEKARTSKGLQFMRFCSKLASQVHQSSELIDEETFIRMGDMIKFITSSQLVAWKDIFKNVKTDKTTKKVLASIENILREEEKRALVNIEACKGQVFRSLKIEDSPSMAKFKKTKQRRLNVIKRLKTREKEKGEQPRWIRVATPVLAADSKWHFKRMLSSARLYDQYLSDHFDSWHIRNIMEMQWGIEQIYRFIAAIEGVEEVKTHSFTMFQRLVQPSGAITKFINELDLGIRIYYPHLSHLSKDKEKVVMNFFMARTKANQQRFFEQSKEGKEEKERNKALATKQNTFQILNEAVTQIGIHLEEVEKRA